MKSFDSAGPLYRINGHAPRLGVDVFVAPTAAVIGDVLIGDNSSVWFSAVVRGDELPIIIGNNTNIQDGVVIHTTSEVERAIIGNRVTIGHNAVLHGCHIEDDAMVGIGAIVLDGACVGSGAIVAAGAIVPPGKQVPPGTLWIGNPGAVRRDVSAREKAFLEYAPVQYRLRATQYVAQNLGSSRGRL